MADTPIHDKLIALAILAAQEREQAPAADADAATDTEVKTTTNE
jgi:hypothetical protein